MPRASAKSCHLHKVSFIQQLLGIALRSMTSSLQTGFKPHRCHSSRLRLIQTRVVSAVLVEIVEVHALISNGHLQHVLNQWSHNWINLLLMTGKQVKASEKGTRPSLNSHPVILHRTYKLLGVISTPSRMDFSVKTLVLRCQKGLDQACKDILKSTPVTMHATDEYEAALSVEKGRGGFHLGRRHHEYSL